MANVLVTGANGFIGGHVVRYLRETGGLSVHPGTRDGRAGSRRIELRDPASLPAALAGIGAVVHCAVGDRAVTVDGTRDLLRAAASAGVRRVVYFSSMSVYGGATGCVTEDTPLIDATGEGYAAWKAAAEQACLAETGVETVRLRPTVVYGPGGAWWLGQFAKRIQSGNWGTFGKAGEGICNPVHISDVASAVAAALSSDAAAAGQAFNVNGPETTTWNDWFSSLAYAIGAPPLQSLSPAALQARVYASLPLKALGRVRPGLARNWLLGVPGRSELGLFALQATYPTDAARAAMGWQPTIPIAAGLASSVDWLRAEGLAA